MFGLVYQASQAVAASGSVYELIEEDGLIITAVFTVENAPESMRGEDGGVGVIIGFPAADLPREIPTPDGAALLLVIKPLLPSELAYIEAQEDGQAARRHLVDLLRRQPRPHVATAHRPPVI